MLKRDINEVESLKDNIDVIKALLLDNTTKKNIIWATDNYSKYGSDYSQDKPITPKLISKENSAIIKPRIEKTVDEQIQRSKDSAEVFTPSWICNRQNNVIDEAWFGRKDVFNIENGDGSWIVTDRIIFDNGKTWQDYVLDIRLETTCGETPYLVSRYDTVTGEEIELNRRIGLLDRKFRVIKENAASDDEWDEYAFKALKSVYGYEFQGDSLLIARENLLLTFMDYYYDRYEEEPDIELILKAINIISWNIWQMDGLKLVVPFSCHDEESEQGDLFGFEEDPKPCKGCENGKPEDHNGTRCRIMDWQENKKVKYIDVLWGKG